MVYRKSIEEVIAEGDHERIAQSVWSDSQGKIVDRDTFDLHFGDFISDKGSITPKQEQLRDVVWKQLKENHPNVSSQRIFTKAGGKNLKQDRKQTASVVVTDEKEYIKKGARRTDLKGYDTKTTRKQKHQLDIVGKRSGKIVYGRKTYVTVKGKKQVRYRDAKGRFISRNTKK